MSKTYGQGGSDIGSPVYGKGGIRNGSVIYGEGGLDGGSPVYSDMPSIPFKLSPTSIIAITGDAGTFTRATAAAVTDHDNVIREVNSGEVRFPNLRRVENLIEKYLE